jgi:hypothetical protein
MIRLVLGGSGLLIVGCAKEETDPSITGSLNLPEHGEQADIVWDKAFGYVDGSTMIAFVTGAPDATCASISAYLGSNDGPLKKVDVLQGGSCTMLVRTHEWDGGWSASYPNAEDSWPPSIDSNIRCEFGDGEWTLESRGSGYEDYYWSGTVWHGIPDVFDWEFTGGKSGFELTVDMSHYDGGFLYSDNHDDIPGSGVIAGVVKAKWCGALSGATVLSGG